MRKPGRNDARDQLRDPAYLETYLQDHLRKGPDEFRVALREAVLSQPGGVAGISRRIGVARTGLYKALSATGNPSYLTVYRILEALGMSSMIIRRKALHPRRRKTMEEAKTPNEAGRQHDAGQTPKGRKTQKLQEKQKGRIMPGSGKGIFVMRDDFDAPLQEFSDYM